MNRSHRPSFLVRILFLCAGALIGFPVAVAQTASTGSVEGRVLNLTNGQYLHSVRVSVEGTRLETFTDSFGQYRFTDVPAGATRLRVVYIGLPAADATVTVVAGKSVTQNFSLGSTGATSADPTKLDPFVVATARETNSNNMATNEQRAAANIKTVVSSDVVGDIVDDNVGELMKYLPGITVDYAGAAEPSAISVRGFGSNFTGVTSDGGTLASASNGNPSRTFNLSQVSVNSISRVEITKVPTPETAASQLGGSVNLVSRSSFESARARFNYRTYLSFHNHDHELFKKTPGPGDKDTYKVLPGFDFNYLAPITKDFGISVSGLSSAQFNGWQYESNATWRFTGAFATVAAPYLRTYNYSPGPKRSDRNNISVKADWRPAQDHVLSLGVQANYFHNYYDFILQTFDIGGTETPTPATGAPLTFGPTFTYGPTGRGVVSQGKYAYDQLGLTRGVSLNHRYRGRTWEIDSGASASVSKSWYRDGSEGHFFDVQTSMVGVSRVLFDNINWESIPGKITALDANGAVIDYTRASNYRITNVFTAPRDAVDKIKEGRVNVKRDLPFLPFPASLKLGGLIQQQDREIDRALNGYTFVGPDGLPNTADDSADRYLDPKSNIPKNEFGFGAIQYPSAYTLYSLFKSNPAYFTQTNAQAVAAETNRINRSFVFGERITAAYLQGEVRLIENRLRLLGGVRFERTENDGLGPRVEPNAVFQRDASGRLVRDAGGALVRRVDAGAVGSLQELALIRKARGSSASRSYDGYYPSLHATYNFTENLILRAAYAETFGRPNLDSILPNTTVNESTAANPAPGTPPGTITVTNAGLRPYGAKNYDLSLEYYFSRGGVLSFGAFRKDLTDFFGVLNTIATPDLLDQFGLEPTYLGWTLQSRINTGAARVDGLEFNYNQPLTFLPWWGKHLSFLANGTKLKLQGSNETDFNDFIPESASLGLSFSRSPVVVMLRWNYRGEQRNLPVTNAPNAFQYSTARTNVDVNAEYQLTKHVTLFANVRNILNQTRRFERRSTQTAPYSNFWRNSPFGIQSAVGIKGSF
ncbi:MAG: TonB-dependent receptor [Opitutaceae bacterium]|nr:TonB-dependent receptor [Opitutaceae bacterium]